MVFWGVILIAVGTAALLGISVGPLLLIALGVALVLGPILKRRRGYGGRMGPMMWMGFDQRQRRHRDDERAPDQEG